MATNNPGSSPVHLFPASNKFESKVNMLKKLIETKKLEVRKFSKEMRDLIAKKEERIIRELDAIWGEVNIRIDNKKKEIHKKIQGIEAQRDKLLELLKDLDPETTPLPQISEKIESVKREMSIDIPYVKVSWKIDELKASINLMCRCEQQIITYNEGTSYKLEWSKCGIGNGDNQIQEPWGIATNSINGNIYVTDRASNRIQVFSMKGEWIRTIKSEGMILPVNITILDESAYVQCWKSILKLNKYTDQNEISKSYDFCLGSICTDKNRIYAGKFPGMSLIVLTLDLVEENAITLKTEFCNQAKTSIKDISLSQEVFYILLSNSDYPIQAFSREGVLTRCVVQKNSIHSVYRFCLDQQLNILVADNGDSKVKIFSNEGKLLTEFGRVRKREVLKLTWNISRCPGMYRYSG